MGERVAKWVMNEASKRDDWETELLDVASFNLPMYHDATLPAMMGGKYDDPAVTKWSEKVRAADAFLFITPEYNHGLPAPLKNAIDWLYPEWANKAAGIVSYSGSGGAGIRAAEQLRLVLTHVGIANVQSIINVPNVATTISEDGTMTDEVLPKLLTGQFIQLTNWAEALKPLRRQNHA
jgi:NAD(P)H-dependent FMN reductase